MGWSAWALDNIWLVAGGGLAISFALQYAITWLFKNSGTSPANDKSK